MTSKPTSDASAKPTLSREKKKGTGDFLVLALLAERQRHGYELAKLIEQRSGGELTLQVASLYTLLSRLEKKGWIAGRWVEKAGERRRRFYRLTTEGKKALSHEQQEWRRFVAAVERVIAPQAASARAT